MTDVEIGTMDTTIEFEPEVITASPPSGAIPDARAGVTGPEIAQLRDLLRPVIMDLLAEQYDLTRRMMG